MINIVAGRSLLVASDELIFEIEMNFTRMKLPATSN